MEGTDLRGIMLVILRECNHHGKEEAELTEGHLTGQNHPPLAPTSTPPKPPFCIDALSEVTSTKPAMCDLLFLLTHG